MPVIPVPKWYICQHLKGITTEKDIDDLCFEFGTEFDGECEDEDTGELMWRIEVAANRYDLLSPEGIVQALRVFQGIGEPPNYTIVPPVETIIIDENAATVRPFCVAAVVRNLSLDQMKYKSFIDLQDKLHQNICRKRHLVSIGTHDLSTVKGPFRYTAMTPEDISFIPLNQTQKMNGHEMIASYTEHAQLKSYLHLIKDSAKYPCIVDANNVILSVPPIINGDHSKMSKETKDVFIEVTALDPTKARIVLHVLIASLTEHTSQKYTVEQVNVQYTDNWSSNLPFGTDYTGINFNAFNKYNGSRFITPDMEEAKFTTTVKYVKGLLGINDKSLNDKLICSLLQKMLLKAIPKGDGENIEVIVPITRSDVLHECDIAEDVGIAYGFNNIQPRCLSAAKERPMTGLSSQVRQWVAEGGFNEVYNWALICVKDAFDNFGYKMEEARTCDAICDLSAKVIYDPYSEPAVLGDSKTSEFEIVRPNLLCGLLKCLAHNTHAGQPIQLFEIGNVVALTPQATLQSVNRNWFSAVSCSNGSAGFETLHGLADYILMKLQMTPSYFDMMEESAKANLRTRSGIYYKLEELTNDPALVKNRSVSIVAYKDEACTDRIQTIGRLGILKPSVVREFGINMPASILEFTLEPFVEWLPEVDLID